MAAPSSLIRCPPKTSSFFERRKYFHYRDTWYICIWYTFFIIILKNIGGKYDARKKKAKKETNGEKEEKINKGRTKTKSSTNGKLWYKFHQFVYYLRKKYLEKRGGGYEFSEKIYPCYSTISTLCISVWSIDPLLSTSNLQVHRCIHRLYRLGIRPFS